MCINFVLAMQLKPETTDLIGIGMKIETMSMSCFFSKCQLCNIA